MIEAAGWLFTSWLVELLLQLQVVVSSCPLVAGDSAEPLHPALLKGLSSGQEGSGVQNLLGLSNGSHRVEFGFSTWRLGQRFSEEFRSGHRDGHAVRGSVLSAAVSWWCNMDMKPVDHPGLNDWMHGVVEVWWVQRAIPKWTQACMD